MGTSAPGSGRNIINIMDIINIIKSNYFFSFCFVAFCNMFQVSCLIEYGGRVWTVGGGKLAKTRSLENKQYSKSIFP